MRPLRYIIIIPLIVSLIFGCVPTGQTHSFAQNIDNVILIVVDTLRANHLGFMGYERETSPFLDELAERSIIFDNMWTPRSLTLPSFASMFTGIHPTKTNIYQNAWPLPESLHSLVEDFQDAGFNTYGYPTTDILAARYGIGRGFDTYDMAEELPRMAPEEIDAVITGLQDETEPFFLLVHFWEPHQPYDPDPEVLDQFAEPYFVGQMDGEVETFVAYNKDELPLSQADLRHAIDRYDAEIRWLDNQLVELFDFFEEKGYFENSLIIVTADHGESLGEGHFFGHLRDLDVELQIPLFFHFPNDLAAGTRINALCEITDILPTVMDLLGIEIPEDIDGISLLPLIIGDTEEHRDTLLSVGTQHEDMFLLSEFDGENRVRLDYGAKPSLVEIDEETREKLRSLGYIH